MKNSEKPYELKCSDIVKLLGGVQVSTIRRWAALGEIPHRRYSPKTIRFNRDEILEWALKRNVRRK